MNIETIAVLISFAVLLLQILQVVRYVRLEAEVKRVTTELDQTLNRLHRALELTREIHLCITRAQLYLDPLVFQINQQELWKDPAKYEHVVRQGENTASVQSYMIELKATANVIGDTELNQRVQEFDDWKRDLQPGSQGDKVNDLNKVIEKIQERNLLLINSRLSAKI